MAAEDSGAESGGAQASARAMIALDRLAGDLPALGIGLSGGGDSLALLHLATDWSARRGVRLVAATVDHGLRAASAEEARFAARAAAALGIAHQTLHWRDHAAVGNLAAQARQARLDLLGSWARDAGLPAVALGHTRDDVAETLLMRLGRGAGLDGLAAMRDRRHAQGMIWLRPVMALGRAELRQLLRERGVAWIDDPSNEDTRSDRVRARQAIAALGLDARLLALSADNLSAARDALLGVAAEVAAGATMRDGALIMRRDSFDAGAGEVRRLIVVAAVRTVTGEPYPPRRDTLTHALTALASGTRVSLAGTLLTPTAYGIVVSREPAAAARAPMLVRDGIWDGRWQIEGLPQGSRVQALSGTAEPGLWSGDRCMGPLPSGGSSARLVRSLGDFMQNLGVSPLTGTKPH